MYDQPSCHPEGLFPVSLIQIGHGYASVSGGMNKFVVSDVDAHMTWVGAGREYDQITWFKLIFIYSLTCAHEFSGRPGDIKAE